MPIVKTSLVVSVVLSAGMTLAVGCGRKDETAASGTSEAGAKTRSASNFPARASSAHHTGDGPADRLMSEAKKLAEGGKYHDAMNQIKQLSGIKLTPVQQKLADDLKAMVQKQIANSAAQDASMAIDNALGGGQ